jgi:hypothetical protein
MAQGFPQTPVTPEHGAAVAVPENARRQLLRWGVIGALGGFLFGYDTGIVPGPCCSSSRTSTSVRSSRAPSSASCCSA